MSNEIEATSNEHQTVDVFEQLAVLTALRNAIDDEIRKGAGVRAEADRRLMDSYGSGGFDRAPLKVCGEKVGTITISMSKAQAAVTDKALFDNWCVSNGMPIDWYLDEEKIPEEALEELRAAHPEWFFWAPRGKWGKFDRLKPGPNDTVIDPDTGEIVPGVRWHASQPIGTVVRGCKPDEVFDAMRRHGLDMGAIGGLLEGPSEGAV